MPRRGVRTPNRWLLEEREEHILWLAEQKRRNADPGPNQLLDVVKSVQIHNAYGDAVIRREWQEKENEITQHFNVYRTSATKSMVIEWKCVGDEKLGWLRAVLMDGILYSTDDFLRNSDTTGKVTIRGINFVVCDVVADMDFDVVPSSGILVCDKEFTSCWQVRDKLLVPRMMLHLLDKERPIPGFLSSKVGVVRLLLMIAKFKRLIGGERVQQLRECWDLEEEEEEEGEEAKREEEDVDWDWSEGGDAFGNEDSNESEVDLDTSHTVDARLEGGRDDDDSEDDEATEHEGCDATGAPQWEKLKASAQKMSQMQTVVARIFTDRAKGLLSFLNLDSVGQMRALYAFDVARNSWEEAENARDSNMEDLLATYREKKLILLQQVSSRVRQLDSLMAEKGRGHEDYDAMAKLRSEAMLFLGNGGLRERVAVVRHVVDRTAAADLRRQQADRDSAARLNCTDQAIESAGKAIDDRVIELRKLLFKEKAAAKEALKKAKGYEKQLAGLQGAGHGAVTQAGRRQVSLMSRPRRGCAAYASTAD